MSEFDPYTRDDLVSEIEAIRLKFVEAVASEVLKQTEEERHRLEKTINYFQDLTSLPIAENLDQLLLAYDSTVKYQEDNNTFFFDDIHYHSNYRRIKSFVDAYKKPEPVVKEPFKMDVEKRKGLIESFVKILRG